MRKPTEKQKAFIEEICGVLEIKNPKCKTIEEASNFIQSHLWSYNQELKIAHMKHWDAQDFYEAGIDPYGDDVH